MFWNNVCWLVLILIVMTGAQEDDSLEMVDSVDENLLSEEESEPVDQEELDEQGALAEEVLPDSLNPELLRYSQYYRRFVKIPRLQSSLQHFKSSQEMHELVQAGLDYANKNYDQAWNSYRTLLPAWPELDGLIRIRMAHCALELQMVDSVRPILKSPVVQSRLAWKEATDRILVGLLLADTNVPFVQVMDSLTLRIRTSSSREYRAWLKMQMGDLYVQEDSLSRAQKLYVEAMRLSKRWRLKSFQAAKALEPKVGLPHAKSLRIAYIQEDCKSVEAETCSNHLKELLQRSDLSRAERIALTKHYGNQLQGMQRYAEAAYQYQWLIDHVKLTSSWLQSLQRLYRKAGNRKAAQKISRLFARKFPWSQARANSLWVKAFEYEQEKKYPQARKTYQKLMHRRFKNVDKSKWADFRIGLTWFKQNRYQNAVNTWQKVADDDTRAWPQAASTYFQGLTYLEMGQMEQAKERFIRTTQVFPLSWYAYRARNQLDVLTAADSTMKAGDYALKMLPLSWGETLEWLKALNAKRSKALKYPAIKIREIEVLFRAGFDEQARALVQETYKEYSQELDYLFAVGTLLMDMGEIGEGYRFARRFLNLTEREKMGELPLLVYQWIYPVPVSLRPWVEKQVQGTKLDPLFVVGLMRQESIFQPEIQSWAGARGLMQIMPATGQSVAEQENIENFHPDYLYNPMMAIRLGVRYLDDLWQQHNGNPVYVLCHYNAGPKPASRWQREHETLDEDLRVEEISYWETRDYVKKVLGNYMIYKQAWSAQSLKALQTKDQPDSTCKDSLAVVPLGFPVILANPLPEKKSFDSSLVPLTISPDHSRKP